MGTKGDSKSQGEGTTEAIWSRSHKNRALPHSDVHPLTKARNVMWPGGSVSVSPFLFLKNMHMAKSPRSQLVGLENSLFPTTRAIPSLLFVDSQASIADTWGQHVFISHYCCSQLPSTQAKHLPLYLFAASKHILDLTKDVKSDIHFFTNWQLEKGIKMPEFNIWAMETHFSSDFFL